MLTLNSVANEFLKVLQASSGSPLVRWLLNALAISSAILPTGWPDNYKLTDGERFDFIVVGSGSAGAIVAARLSESPLVNVLLIEAGGDPPPASVAPSLFAILANTEYDWGYKGYLDDEVGRSHPGRQIFMTRGKMLGGCSSNNYEIYSRGAPQDYDDWAQEAPGWDWNTCLYYFKKLENMTDATVFQNPYNAYLHSTNGPVKLTRPDPNPYVSAINEIVLNSYQELGVKVVLENNGPEIEGVSQPHFTFGNGRRSSTAEAYLKPNKDRPNLKIAKYSRVFKILVNPYTLKADGVEVLLQDGTLCKVYADLEIIVSAGTIDSPKLLMLSGIGPREELQKHGINVLLDLPVGKNLHDHSYAPILFTGKKGLSSVVPNLLVPTELDSVPVPIQNGFFRLNNTFSSPNKPQFQFFSTYFGATASLVLQYGCKTVINYDDAYCTSLAEANLFREVFLTSLLLLHPLSRGQVKLQSSSPFENPLIEMGYFRNEEDLKTLVRGVKYISGLTKTSYFRKVGGQMSRLNVPACKEFKWGSDAYWTCYVRNTVGSLLHPVGTCKMGIDGVVDERLRVHGIHGLRVVDASVMPRISSGNTNGPTMMIGERASDLIKEDYSQLYLNYFQ
ncbi:glucose dehydrogenase [FAD, quinone] [Manduca sexta]|uniref:Glucose-methanol-choline oxidoreductase N-terminal domain-containing protein n=1 Tax=Manduca sexta TaxID=7130 RepID=A0A922CAE5_MANSE|nr:glucose dehydrogenase [FAD, quinone] [Manduca sexta]XP_030021670.1 glucose dehydrogenase [FAD, quinone] [Manduca sexta]XP_030021752.1 glucose dehydrogenase [FAD, quinone] [Manduca sexta]XP_030021836.1 glucose dehydrogenase [FAD, quinone] [Manduca sexta]KAG6440301.1 hypothetical protein O3G_MSEX001196 [Manduca sexta]KAG6440302.1 hypothetical protein O3G_MSEX001196 [Manduca sexta]KAG6440303.1 hypothetical protein O3G_MSEX001196 [Manduca sexta]KAG6440304.1 hypothetical protein O3G_MSEX001196